MKLRMGKIGSPKISSRIVGVALLLVCLWSSAGFAGITRKVCKSNIRDLKICVEEPNAREFIPLNDVGTRHRLEELESYRAYADESCSLDFEKMKVTNMESQEIFNLECGETKPGTCAGNF